jgi:hypothetical protein
MSRYLPLCLSPSPSLSLCLLLCLSLPLSLCLSLSLSLPLSLSPSLLSFLLISLCDQITLKSAGVFCEAAASAAAKRKSDFIQNKKLSTKPAEIVAETFCHLFTIEGHHISELKKFYRSVLVSIPSPLSVARS